jgi:hypothetical protein
MRLEHNVRITGRSDELLIGTHFLRLQAEHHSGGKSELKRARRSSAATGGNPKESATERETVPTFVGIRVKR